MVARTVVLNEQLAAIPGWFQPYDVDVFRFLLRSTTEHLGGGDLAELGVFLGKSATLLGGYVGSDDELTVVDLFGTAADSADNAVENADQYPDLTRSAFERHYLGVHPELPRVVTGPSSSVVDHARHGRHRFVHVDASHLYEHVLGDIAAVRTLLAPDGVVAFDDYRSEHTPGVAAAVWQAVGRDLRPFAITPVKLYATFGDAAGWYDRTAAWAAGSDWASETQRIAGHDVLRLWPAGEADRTGAADPAGPVRRGVRRARRVLERR